MFTKIRKNVSFITAFGIFLMLMGPFLPVVRIANENINMLENNGFLIVLLAAICIILVLLNKTFYTVVPAIFTLVFMFDFVVKTSNKLEQINQTYNYYVSFNYGLVVTIFGSLIVLISVLLDNEKIKALIKNMVENAKIKLKTKEVFNKDGIKGNKLVVTIGNNKEKIKNMKLNEKINTKIIKQKAANIKGNVLTKISNRKKLSISKFKEEKKIEQAIEKNHENFNYNIVSSINNEPAKTKFDMTKWIINNVSCTNCGAVIKNNDTHCFLCDCKVK